MRGVAGGADGGAVRSAAGTVSERRAQGALRPESAQRADSRGDAKREERRSAQRSDGRDTKQDGHLKQHRRQRWAPGGGGGPSYGVKTTGLTTQTHLRHSRHGPQQLRDKQTHRDSRAAAVSTSYWVCLTRAAYAVSGAWHASGRAQYALCLAAPPRRVA